MEDENKIKILILDKKIMKNNQINRIKYKKTLIYILKKREIKSAIIIQRSFRRYINYMKYLDDLAQTKDLLKSYINIETILGDKIEDIDENFFYTVDNFAFDVREIYKNNLINPYTNLPFNSNSKKQLNRILNNYKTGKWQKLKSNMRLYKFQYPNK